MSFNSTEPDQVDNTHSLHVSVLILSSAATSRLNAFQGLHTFLHAHTLLNLYQPRASINYKTYFCLFEIRVTPSSWQVWEKICSRNKTVPVHHLHGPRRHHTQTSTPSVFNRYSVLLKPHFRFTLSSQTRSLPAPTISVRLSFVHFLSARLSKRRSCHVACVYLSKWPAVSVFSQ